MKTMGVNLKIMVQGNEAVENASGFITKLVENFLQFINKG